MRVEALSARDFRSYERLEVSLGEGLTVVSGPNGAGKTNLLEALYFGCTGRSCRTTNEREIVRFGAGITRVVVRTSAADGPHELAVGFEPGRPKHLQIDGSPVERMLEAPGRPLMSVFLPDRLGLVKGTPGARRAHLDQLVAALWPARASTRRSYAQALAQRNALIARIRAGVGGNSALGAWDGHLARHGIALMADRDRAVAEVLAHFGEIAGALGLDGDPGIRYRPRSKATDAAGLAAELDDRVAGDLERGFTGHGPHRDELLLEREGRELRAFGSQGQQRLALLALLLAEREAIAHTRDTAPVMLLDDVMSELDHHRRRALVELLRASPGQALITTTDLEHVPGAMDAAVQRIAVAGSAIVPVPEDRSRRERPPDLGVWAEATAV